MIKRNSWHYKLANFGSDRVWAGEKIDFCKYFRCVISGLFVFSITALVLLTAGVWFIDTIVELFKFFMYGTKISEMAIAMLIVLGAVSIGMLFAVFKIKLEDYLYYKRKSTKRYVETEPGFFTLAYRKFKDKTCHLLEVEDY